MAREQRPWTVLRHDAIEKHEDNLWTLEGDLPGMALRRRMTLARMADGRVVVYGAMCADEATMKQITDWGEPAVMIVPNGFHRLDAHAWRERFPKTRVYCPEGSAKRVRDVVEVHGLCEDLKGDDTVRYETLDGVGKQEGVLTVQSGGRVTRVFNDVFFNHPDLPGFAGWVMKNITDSTGGPKTTRIARLFLVKERVAFQAHLLKLANEAGLSRLVPGHGQVIERDAPSVLRAVANTV
jgi:hypothetical protein